MSNAPRSPDGITPKRFHPDADPDCSGCQRAAAGICFAHSGANSLPEDDDERRCIGVTSRGVRCRKWAVSGTKTCAAHDEARAEERSESARRGRQDTQRRLFRDAKAFFESIDSGRRPSIDALEELENLAAESIALKDWFLKEVARQIKEDSGDANVLGEILKFYIPALERAAKQVESYGKAGLEKRHLEIREELATLVTATFNKLLTFVPVEQREAARLELVRTVAAIEAPAA